MTWGRIEDNYFNVIWLYFCKRDTGFIWCRDTSISYGVIF